MNWVYLIISSGIAYGLIVYSRQIVNMVGRSSWFEHKLGPGGTQTAWKLLGFLIFFLALLNATGSLKCVNEFIQGFFGPMRDSMS